MSCNVSKKTSFSVHSVFPLLYICDSTLQVEIVKLKLDKDRRKIIERKAKPKLADKEKGKHKEVQMDTS